MDGLTQNAYGRQDENDTQNNAGSVKEKKEKKLIGTWSM